MPDAYEEFAELFMNSLAGQMAGLSKEQVIAKFRFTFPDEAQFRAHVATLQATAEQQVAAAQAQLKPGQQLGIAYPVPPRPDKLH